MFKKGQRVVVILSGAGVETASLHAIEQVSKGKVRVDDLDTLFDAKTGRTVEPSPFAGFSMRLVQLEAEA